MKIYKLRNRLSTLAAAAALSLLTVHSASAAPWNLADTPLFLASGVKPNLIMAIDDSGSMDFELLLRGNDGAAWWRTAASGNCTTAANNNSFAGCIADGATDQVSAGELNFNNSGNSSATWKKFAYLFPNGSGNNTENRRRLVDSTANPSNDHFAIPPLPVFGWSRSFEYNRAYFNPTTTYSPWPNGGGYTFVNAVPTATKWDPVYNGQADIDLTKDFANTASYAVGGACDNSTLGSGAVSANYLFRMYTPMVLPANTCFKMSGDNNWYRVNATPACTVGTTNGCSTFKNGNATAANITVANGALVAIKYFPATFYSSSATAGLAIGFTGVPVADGKTPGGGTMYRYEIKPINFGSATPNAAYNAAMQNFANWFQYYRKRHQALRAGLGTAFQTLAGTRVAGFRINQSASPNGPDVTMGDIDVAANKTALYTDIYRNWTGSGGTPNREAVSNIIRNFKRGAADNNRPITASCQRNFGMLFTDGFSNPPDVNDGMNGIGNIDGGMGVPFQDNVNGTMADKVMGAYKNTLRSDLAQGKVIVPSACSSVPLDKKLDCIKDPHMNFYAVTLGTRGLQFNPDITQDPFTTTPTWPTAFPARHPNAVDDIWHATINSRGQLLNAKSSSELADKLSAVLLSIIERVGSASSAAVNSGSVSSDTRLFQASFDSKDWSGKLTARQVLETGELNTEVLATVPAAGSRNILTVNKDTNAGVPFRWANIGATNQTALKLTGADTLAQNRLNWLRGAQTDEAPAANNFRKRTVILGDIINSAPAFVGAPPFRYPDTMESAKYTDFRATWSGRTHMVYTGANDGMLHGFVSNDTDPLGAVTEQFAFIPSVLMKNLPQLTVPNYTHHYFVDGNPVQGDAFYAGAWHTLLVGGLNKGGQEIYALDITNPANLTEANASGVVKWEFTDSNDADLGYTYSRPTVVKMNHGAWVVGFGNGYNNTVADGHASTTGNAVLFIRNAATGAAVAKIDTGVGMAQDPKGLNRPNGLSTPIFIDRNGDRVVDYAYAGDLFGNLWKFDLSSSNPAAWNVAHGAPLFVAINEDGEHQPITSRPNVSVGPRGVGWMIVFGTGKYIETTDYDKDTYGTQSFYGIWDKATGAATDVVDGRDSLTQQTIDLQVNDYDFGDGNVASVRALSDNAMASTSVGWYIDLVSPTDGDQGEMQVTDSIIRFGHVIFTTLVPNSDPCESGGTSWLMEMNMFTGGSTPKTPWDLNDNGKFDGGDKVTIGGNTYSVNSVQLTVGIAPKGALTSNVGDVRNDPDGEGAGGNCPGDFLIFPGTNGSTEVKCRDPGPWGYGRQSWRQAQ
jgi:type IV pilus assembly protein PilY1